MTEVFGRARQRRVLIALALVIACALLFPGLYWPDKYTALTAGVQAIGVIVALTVAVLTLRADSRDRRVDRVLALHQELTTGEVQAARVALAGHLRRQTPTGKAITVSLKQLGEDPKLSRYAKDNEHASEGHACTPLVDARLLLRFFERADAIRTSGAAYVPLYAELIAGHAFWWSRHLIPSGDSRFDLTTATHNIGEWLKGYARSHQENPVLTEWVKDADETHQNTTH